MCVCGGGGEGGRVGGGGGSEGKWEISESSDQLCFHPKAAVKSKVY